MKTQLEYLIDELNDDESQKFEELFDCMTEILDEDMAHLENKYNCTILNLKEKHHSLQYTHYITITGLFKEELNMEIENGINNGTQLVSYSFEQSLVPDGRIANVLKDIVVDEEAYELPCNKRFSIIKARAVLPHWKGRIMELLRKEAYDNYVTGGGTLKTKSHYKNEFDKMSKMGLFWKGVYEEIQTDITWA